MSGTEAGEAARQAERRADAEDAEHGPTEHQDEDRGKGGDAERDRAQGGEVGQVQSQLAGVHGPGARTVC